MIDASWIIIDRATGKAVLKTWDFETVQFVNLDKYRVMPVLAYLQSLNAKAKEERR